MKKIVLSLCALAALVSCAKELDSKIQLSESEAASAEGTTLVRAGFAEDVKTVLGPVSGNARPVYWQATDAIQINGVNSTSIEIRQDNPAVANFTIVGVVNYPYRAAYPAALASGYKDNTVLVNVPAVQNYVEGTYDPNAAVMLGYAAEGEVAFKNAMSFLKINITGGTNSSNIKSVRVRAFYNKEAQGNNKGCEAMSGEFKAVFTEGNFTFTRDLCDNSSVTLDCGDGVAQGTDLYIAIPAQTYHQGLNLFIVSADNQCQEIVSKKAFDAEPGKIYATTLAYNGGMTYVGAGIYTPADWDAFGIQYTLLGYCNEFKNEEGIYVLQEDLTAPAFQRLGGAGEGSTLEFAGTLDGQNHVITSTEQAVPFFTYITGIVKNLTIAGERKSFASTAGWGTCQFAFEVRNGGLVENCVVDFDVTAKPTADADTYYYGMFRNIKDGATVKGCIAKSNYTIDYNGVTEKNLYVLPFAYSNEGTVEEDCRNEGNINFVQDPGQKVIVGCIYKNMDSLEGFVNTGNFTIKSAKGADVAGVAVYGGGSIKNCVNGVEDSSSEYGVINVTAIPEKSALGYRVGGIACYADASSDTNCGLFYGDKNYGDITLTKTGDKYLSGTGIGGIACFVRYGAYGTSENNTYSVFDGCENKGHLTIHEPDGAATQSPMFLGGIIGFVLNVNGFYNNNALLLTAPTTTMNGNYIICRVNCKNTGTLELASANSSNIGASSSGARQHYIGGICGFAYGMGKTSSSSAHYAAIRGTQDGVIKVGSAKAGNSCAGGIIGGGCYVKIDQGSAKVTYQATSLQTNDDAPKYRGACAAVAGFMLKHSVIGIDNGGAVNATMVENTGLQCSGSLQDYTSLCGYAGITGNKSVDNTNTMVKHQLTVYGNPIATLNGKTITDADLYGGGGKTIDQN